MSKPLTQRAAVIALVLAVLGWTLPFALLFVFGTLVPSWAPLIVYVVQLAVWIVFLVAFGLAIYAKAKGPPVGGGVALWLAALLFAARIAGAWLMRGVFDSRGI